MHKKAPPKPLGFFEKRVPKNDKFAHIPGKLDTGLTVAKVKFITAQEFARRRNEIFYRLSKGQLYQLYGEYETSDSENMSDCLEIGEPSSPKIVSYSKDAEALNLKPYLIFDVREAADYHKCHLLHARSYPFTMMRRDQVHPELYNFKNKPETLIIIYCDDEKVSCDAAKLFVDRGADNIFLLTGGLFEFGTVYPSYLEGEPPAACTPKKEISTTRRTGLTRIAEDSGDFSGSNAGRTFSNSLNASRLQSLGNSSMLTSTGTGTMSTSRLGLTRRDDRSESGYSVASNASVAESVISKSIARKGKF